MKYTKLVPNARLTKEWEGYVKSWTLNKKSKAKKSKSSCVSVQTLPSSTNDQNHTNFSLQEIKTAAQKHTMNFAMFLAKDKLNL